MTKLTFLNIETLEVVEAVDSRTAKEIVQAAQAYYKKNMVSTRICPEDGFYMLKERESKNTLLAVEDGCDNHVYEAYKKLVHQLPYYAVAHGFMCGIFRTWEQAKDCVEGCRNKRHKKFFSLEAAVQFMKENDAPLRAYECFIK